MAQLLVDGAISGVVIALLAAGFAVVYLPTRIFHVALGGIYVIAPLIAWTVLRYQWSWPVAIAASLISGIVLGLACEALNHSWLARKPGAEGAHLISSLGLYMVFSEAAALVWGNETKSIRMGLDRVWEIGPVVVTGAQASAAAAASLMLATFYIWLRWTGLGLTFRALASNPTEIALRGYSLQRLRFIAFGLSGLFGATAAILNSMDLGFGPRGGLVVLFLAVVASIVGGRESFAGPVLGGLLVGILRAEIAWFTSTRWQDAAVFLLLALVLAARPGGVLGTTKRVEAL